MNTLLFPTLFFIPTFRVNSSFSNFLLSTFLPYYSSGQLLSFSPSWFAMMKGSTRNKDLLVFVAMVMTGFQLLSAAALPLCSVVTAIASDSYFFSIPLGNAALDHSAIVIATHGGFAEKPEPLVINATYFVPPGASVTRVEMNSMSIPFVVPNSDIQVWVSPTGDPIPFTLVAYQANAPSCFIPISSSFGFKGTIPSAFQNSFGGFTPAFIYFSTVVPVSANTIRITVTGQPAPAGSVFVIPNKTDASTPEFVVYKSGDVIPASSGEFRFAYVPGVEEPPTTASLFEVEIAVQYSFSISTSAPQPSSGPLNPTDPSNPTPPAKKGSRLNTVIKVLFVAFLLWFISQGYYNYTTQGIHNFPFMFPFGGQIALFLASCGISTATRQDYQDIETTRI